MLAAVPCIGALDSLETSVLLGPALVFLRHLLIDRAEPTWRERLLPWTPSPSLCHRCSCAPPLRSAQDVDLQDRHRHQDIHLPPRGEPVPPAHKAA